MSPIPDTGPVRAFLDPHHLELGARVAAFAGREIAPLPEPADDAAARRAARELLALPGPRRVVRAHRRAAPALLLPRTRGARGRVPARRRGVRAAGARYPAHRPRWLGRAEAPLGARGAGRGGHGGVRDDRARGGLGRGRHRHHRPPRRRYLRAGRHQDADLQRRHRRFLRRVRLHRRAPAATRASPRFSCPADTTGLRFVRPLVLAAPHPLGEIALRPNAGSRRRAASAPKGRDSSSA